ncbi:UxaA family hydrolase [Dongshaea marina]|uniref:UxaA family hydrolase n=1 Tax=Dongshaea marina TaxID=2047966 RepID=UPI000D3E1663|nr:altronate dehydratase family protein [Dongshaea marina]
MDPFIKIHPKDNLVVALTELEPGETLLIEKHSVTVKQPLAPGSKFAIKQIEPGSQVIKYGEPIGLATQAIGIGEWIHTHNLKTALTDTHEYHYQPEFAFEPSPVAGREIQAYLRDNGDIALRNELWVIPTVACVNGIARQIIERFKKQQALNAIDGIELLAHPYGCSQLGEDHQNTRRILTSMAHHPHAGAVLIIGLGCENNQLSELKPLLSDIDPGRIRYLEAQEIEDELEAGCQLLTELFDKMSRDRRQTVAASRLKIGLECGGSDGFSGITANPLLGLLSDYLLTQGASVVLTEVPEMFGAEHLLFNRCRTPEIFQQALGLIEDFKDYYRAHQQPIYENPSPGNKKGGISTLEEKSLGCTQKAGAGLIDGVLRYGERLQRPGLHLLEAPGNDAVATSALIAAGCHLVLFTTGRGTPYGGFAPTLKISSNSAIAHKKPHWIDLDAGVMLDGTKPEQLLESLLDLLCETASGKLCCNERNQFKELAIFKSGVTL